ncbi:MAG: GAF domain-containing protein [Lachnospiraceae bacterium]|nr:GAF domain-containing protein [Lachnospiraceae bacterium]
MNVDYTLLAAQVRAFAESEPNWLPLLANTSALLYEVLPDLNWAGFYLNDRKNPQELILGPFQGKTACIRIAYGKGVCGTAAQSDTLQLVPNVHEFPGHIACDSASNSEIVIPLHAEGKVIGVLDIDSPLLERFDGRDAAGLLLVANALEETGDFKERI